MIVSLLNQALVALPLIVGAYLTLSLLKLPDFSIESAYLFGGVMAYVAGDLPLPSILFSALLGGMLVGAVVSTLNQCFKLPFLLSAILTNGLFHGVTQYVLGTGVRTFHPSLALSEPLLFILVGVGLLGMVFFGLRSQLGYTFAIYGNNPRFFQHHSPSGRYVLFFGVMAGHGCAGLGGFLFALSNGFVDLTMNVGLVLLCLTALILGKTLVPTHRPTLLVPLVGLLSYFCIQQSLLHIGLNLKYFNAFQALFVLTMLCLFQKKGHIALNHLGV